MKSRYLLVPLLPLMVLGWRSSETAAAGGAAQNVESAHEYAPVDACIPVPACKRAVRRAAKDPVGPEKKQSMVYSVYRWGDSDTYAGWEGVENSALALAEMAPILLTPRLCANGIPAPVMQSDWKKAVEGSRPRG